MYTRITQGGSEYCGMFVLGGESLGLYLELFRTNMYIRAPSGSNVLDENKKCSPSPAAGTTTFINFFAVSQIPRRQSREINVAQLIFGIIKEFRESSSLWRPLGTGRGVAVMEVLFEAGTTCPPGPYCMPLILLCFMEGVSSKQICEAFNSACINITQLYLVLSKVIGNLIKGFYNLLE